MSNSTEGARPVMITPAPKMKAVIKMTFFRPYMSVMRQLLVAPNTVPTS
ncbi:MAG: hypothetical protein IPJ88_02620 [Myxococcales bacterium]|nr:MAG: hypothetical protein IPJ88_02620 [Myxococcales bacterium]